jgi:hypothetical protein
MRKTLSADRIRRHMARSTPDEIRMYIDVLDDDATKKYKEWLRKFGSQMKIKYGHDVGVDVYMEDIITKMHTKLIIARVHDYSHFEVFTNHEGDLDIRPTKNWKPARHRGILNKEE